MQIKFSLLLTIALALVATTTVKACDVCDDDYEVAPGADGGADGTGAGEGADGGAGAGGGGAGAGGDATGVGAAGGAGDKAAIIAKLQADIALLKVACPAVQDNNAADPAANEAEGADPAANEAEAADPAANEAEAADPAANEAEAAGPDAATDAGAAGGGATGDAGAAGGAGAAGDAGAAAGGAAGAVVKGGPVGECPEPPVMELIAGLPGRKANEFTFNVQNTIPEFQQQGEALAPGIIVNFFCDRLKTSCKDDAAEQQCQAFKATIGDSKSGKVADDFNALFGTTSNFAALGNSGQQEVAQAAGAAGAAQDFSQGGPIGDCTESPSIELIKGAAGRDPEEFVFQPGPNPIAAFSGQSVALNPKIIVDFLCNKLNDTCNNKAAQKVCTDFSATVQGKNGKVADDFNALFGKQTNFAAVGESGKPQA